MDRSEFIDKDEYFSDISLTIHEIFMSNFSQKYNFLLKYSGLNPSDQSCMA